MTRHNSPGLLVVALGVGLTSNALAQPAQDDPDDSNQAGPAAPVNPQGSQLGSQPATPPPPPPPTTTTTTVVVPAQQAQTDTMYESSTYSERHVLGIAIAAGGGTSGFTNEQLRGATNLGGEWDVRLTLGTRSPVAFEASYIGSAQRIKALGLDNNAVLVGNGVQGALRLNGTIDAPIQPFVYAGAAWRRYDLTNTSTNTSDVSGKDDVLELPAGIGLAGRFQGLMLDARGEFRYVTNSDLVPTLSGQTDTFGSGFTNTSAAAMHRWGVNANIGYEF